MKIRCMLGACKRSGRVHVPVAHGIDTLGDMANTTSSPNVTVSSSSCGSQGEPSYHACDQITVASMPSWGAPNGRWSGRVTVAPGAWWWGQRPILLPADAWNLRILPGADDHAGRYWETAKLDFSSNHTSGGRTYTVVELGEWGDARCCPDGRLGCGDSELLVGTPDDPAGCFTFDAVLPEGWSPGAGLPEGFRLLCIAWPAPARPCPPPPPSPRPHVPPCYPRPPPPPPSLPPPHPPAPPPRRPCPPSPPPSWFSPPSPPHPAEPPWPRLALKEMIGKGCVGEACQNYDGFEEGMLKYAYR